MMTTARSDEAYWDRQYLGKEELAWDTGRPSPELMKTVYEERIPPGRTLEVGCGTGANAIWLAGQGFQVTAVDMSRVAIGRARRRAAAQDVAVRFLTLDIRAWRRLAGSFDFVLDSGCYHAVRTYDAEGYLQALEQVTRPGSLALVLAGSDLLPEDDIGPPAVGEDEIRRELGRSFAIVRMRTFVFDAPQPEDRRYLGWSCLLRRLAV